MTTGSITYPFDINLQLHDGTAKTATGVGSAAYYDTGDANNRFPAVAVINVSAGDFTTGDETYDCVIEGSTDSAFTTPHELGSMKLLGSGTTVPTGRYTILIDNVQAGVQYRYIRFKATLAGTTPSLTAIVYLAPLFPVS